MANYTKHLPQNLREAYVAALEDPDMLQLRDELALLRSILARKVEVLDDEDIDSATIKDITTLVDKVGKLQSNMVDYEYKSRQVISISMIPIIIKAIIQIIRNRIGDERLASEIGQDIGSIPMLLSEPTKKAEVE